MERFLTLARQARRILPNRRTFGLIGATMVAAVLSVPAMSQVLLDDFNRGNSNTVDGGWNEVQSNGNAAAGARVNGNELILQEPNNNAGREYVWQAVPSNYSSTLNQNNCLMVWAFSFRQTESQGELTGFDANDDGCAIVLAASSSDFTVGSGYAVVLGQAGNTDQIRLVRYNNGLDADANLVDLIAADDFTTERLNVRVTYDPSSDTWALYYHDNGADGFSDPLAATTLAGTVVNSTYTGTALGFLGVLWNHDNNNGEFMRFDNFYVPAGRPTVPSVVPPSATICSNGSVGLTASATTATTDARRTFYSSGGPAIISATGANDGSIYPWVVNVSGLPTSGVTVESVSINGVTHTYPDDMDILLQSPTGTNVILMSDAGEGNDLGNDNYTFVDGAGALSDAGTLPSGYYQPTNYGTPDTWPTSPGPASLSQPSPTLSMFTGNPNGNWNLLIRDDFNQDAGSIASWSITFTFANTVSYTWSPATGLSATTGASVTANPSSTQVYTVTAGHGANACTQSANVTVTVVTAPTTATVGGSQNICVGGTTAGLGGNTPSSGTGAWSIVSGGTGSFSPNAATPNATFTHATGAGPMVLRWTITTSAPCTPSTADVSVTITQPPTTATAGGPQTICALGTSAGLGGNTPGTGTGAWSIVSGGTGSFNPNNTTPNATFTHATGTGPVVVRWAISNAPCPASTADVSITITQPPTTASVGGPQTICELGTTAGLGGNTPGTGTGAWSIVSGGTGSFNPDNTTPNATFTHATGAGPVVVRWTISNAPCAASSADVTITINQPPTASTVGGPQTICELGTTAGLGGNTPGTGTGAWSIVSGGTGSFTPDNTTPNATFTHATGAGPVVVRWTISNAPCTASTADVSITITPAPTTADAGPDQDICTAIGSATMAGNAAVNGAGAWSQVSGPVTATITTPASESTTITGMTTPGSYVFRWTISNAPCTDSEDDVTITSAGCVYYSRATGNVSDPIWSDTPTGTAGPATFTSGVGMVVQSPDVVTNDGTNTVNTLTVDAGGQIILAGGSSMDAHGAVAVNGTITAVANSQLMLSSTGATTLSLANVASFWDLAIDAATGCTVTGDFRIRGSLNLLDGNFDVTGSSVTLRSTSAGTGRLGPVSATASYTGNLRIERYRPAGLTNWMLLASPIQSMTVNHFQDDFITAGYPGSQFPLFDNPVGSNILWPSIRWYDESNTGTNVNDGLQGVSSNAQALSTGQGFAVWAGSGLINTTAFTTDLEGQPPVIAITPVTLPMSYTNTGNATVDGWNLVGNPVPSPIDFETMSLGADVAEYVTYYNPANGNTATYDREFDISTNGGTRYIQSMQGFFLKATGGNVTTTVSESDKANTNSGGMFGMGQESPELLRLRIASPINEFSDEAVVHFLGGAPGMDSRDALKFVLAHDDAPQIATLVDGTSVAINAYGAADEAISIPLMVNVGVTGQYSIGAIEAGGLTLNCLSIEDLETGITTSLMNAAEYTFTMDAAADPAVVRFVLHINDGPSAAFTADNSTVVVGQQVQFTATDASGTYAWSFGDGNVSTEQAPVHAYALPGTYTVTLFVEDGLCTDQTAANITVELSTGLADAAAMQHRAYAAPQGIVVEHGFGATADVQLDLFDATGRRVMARRMDAQRTVLPTDKLASGIWFVQLGHGGDRVTLRVPLTH